MDKTPIQRYNRLAQMKHRNGKRSYLTEIENLKIVIAWLNGDLTEGQAARGLGVDRLEARQLKLNAICEGKELAR